MRAVSGKYKGLRVAVGDGSVKFVDGVAEVSEAQAKALRKLPASYGVSVDDAPKVEPKTEPKQPAEDPKGDESKDETGTGDGGGETKLERPAGNASLEAWQAYAVQEGHDVTDLKQSDIKALFTA